MKNNLKPITDKRDMNFLFYSNHRVNTLNRNIFENEMFNNITRTKSKTVNHFAPERPHTEAITQTHWTMNKLKHSPQESDTLFRK